MAKPVLVVLTGAGISAESGLRTFRDTDGLWEGYDVREVATPGAWRRNQALVLDFYNQRRRDVMAAQPNAAHFALAALEANFDVYIITQNIDDLHERAGSSKVLHLHGEILKMRSENNPTQHYPIAAGMPLGARAADGSFYRPQVVWFEEPVPMIEEAIPVVRSADIFVVIGTSLAVYPAAGLIDYADDSVPKYVIDKSIPSVNHYNNVVPIEMTATAGMAVLTRLLVPEA